jgi:EpsI family protein
LQDVTADVVFWIVRLLAIPAFLQENMIVLPSGTLSVEESCAGMRYLLAALTLGTLYAYLNFNSLRARLIVVLISAFTAVLSNIVRVFIVVYMANVTNMQHSLVREHLTLGWVLFGGMVVVLLLADTYFSRFYRSKEAINEVPQNIKEHKTFMPAPCPKGVLRSIVVVVAAFIIVSIGPASAFVIKNHPKQEHIHGGIKLPENIKAWKGRDVSDDDWMPVYRGAISDKSGYQKNNIEVTVYIGYYLVQKQGQELINQLNRISNVDVWRPGYTRAHVITVNKKQVLEQLIEKNNGDQRLVWYWYNVAGYSTTSKYEAKALQTIGYITGNQQSYVVAVAAGLGGSSDDAREVLRDFFLEAETTLTKAFE